MICDALEAERSRVMNRERSYSAGEYCEFPRKFSDYSFNLHFSALPDALFYFFFPNF